MTQQSSYNPFKRDNQPGIANIISIFMFGVTVFLTIYTYLLYKQTQKFFEKDHNSYLALHSIFFKKYEINKKPILQYIILDLGEDPIKITGVKVKFFGDSSKARFTIEDIKKSSNEIQEMRYITAANPAYLDLLVDKILSKEDSIRWNEADNMFFIEIKYTNTVTGKKFRYFASCSVIPPGTIIKTYKNENEEEESD